MFDEKISLRTEQGNSHKHFNTRGYVRIWTTLKKYSGSDHKCAYESSVYSASDYIF